MSTKSLVFNLVLEYPLNLEDYLIVKNCNYKFYCWSNILGPTFKYENSQLAQGLMFRKMVCYNTYFGGAVIFLSLQHFILPCLRAPACEGSNKGSNFKEWENKWCCKRKNFHKTFILLLWHQVAFILFNTHYYVCSLIQPASLFTHIYNINVSKQDSNLGLSMSHRLNYEASDLITQPPWPDTKKQMCIVYSFVNGFKEGSTNYNHVIPNCFSFKQGSK